MIRDERFDIAKGIAIILVIIGHILQDMVIPKYDKCIVFFNIIYSFHMPLFFWISGYISSIKRYKENAWMFKNILSYAWPAFLFGMLISKQWDTYWFLYTLTECCVIRFLLIKLDLLVEKLLGSTYKSVSTILIFAYYVFGVVVSIVLKYLDKELFNTLYWWFIFYYSGVVCKYISRNASDKYLKFLNKKHKSIALWMGLFLWCILVPFWRFNELPRFYEALYMFIPSYIALIISYIYKLILPMFIIFFIVYKLPDFLICKVKSILAYVGRYTLPIYILHFSLIRNYTENLFFDCMLVLILSLVGPVIIKNVCNKSRILNIMFWGHISKSQDICLF